MILQTILEPHAEICEITEMYYRESGRVRTFDTYFNMFSLAKWRRLTQIRHFSLMLVLRGNCAVELFDETGSLGRQEFSCEEETEVKIPVPLNGKGTCVWFSFEKLNEDAKLIRGAFITEDIPAHDVHIACDICTFRREQYLIRNLNKLNEVHLANPDSPLYGKLDIFVVDNGRTLPEEIENEHIRLFPNMNAGGTGGFTRGLIEILGRREAMGLTHMIFMDDDAVLEPDSLVRTFALLSYVKEEYMKSAVSGAMLREDMQYSSHEGGSHWNGTDCWTRFPGLDLRKRENVILNETPDDPDYAPWWFACYPLTVASEDNLPLPIFIHNDDTEYGLRNHNGFILLNGICVWSPGFENKRSSTLSYYDVRNIMLTDALYYEDGNLKAMKKYCWKRILANTLRYRYDDAALVVEAVEDFLKGPEYLSSLNPEEKNMEIIHKGYALKPLDELTDDPEVIREIEAYSNPETVEEIYDNRIKRNKLFYAATANGWIFPAKKDKVYPFPMGIWPYALFRKKEIILFDPDTHKGIRGKKSYRLLMRSIGYYLKINRLLNAHYKDAQKAYREAFPYLTSLASWRKYLKLDEENNEISA